MSEEKGIYKHSSFVSWKRLKQLSIVIAQVPTNFFLYPKNSLSTNASWQLSYKELYQSIAGTPKNDTFNL
jgi:hypothetical protein